MTCVLVTLFKGCTKLHLKNDHRKQICYEICVLCKASTNFGIRNPKLVIQQVFTFQSANMVGYYFEISLFSRAVQRPLEGQVLKI